MPLGRRCESGGVGFGGHIVFPIPPPPSPSPLRPNARVPSPRGGGDGKKADCDGNQSLPHARIKTHTGTTRLRLGTAIIFTADSFDLYRPVRVSLVMSAGKSASAPPSK